MRLLMLIVCVLLLCLMAQHAPAQCPGGVCTPRPASVAQIYATPRPQACVGPNCGPRPLSVILALPRPR